MYEPTVWGTAILVRKQSILSHPWNFLPCKKPRVHHRVHRFPNLDRTLKHTNQVNIVISCSFKFRFPMHLPTMLRFSNQFLSSSFSELKFLSIPFVLHVPLIPLTTLIMTIGTAGGRELCGASGSRIEGAPSSPTKWIFQTKIYLQLKN
jgi:hypothetical protein